MKVAILGVGGVGGYFGGRLAQSGEQVVFIARGDHLKAMQADGLRIVSPEGDAHVSSVNATDNPASVGPVDVVLVAVKGWQLADASALMKPLLAEHTAVLPLLNGVDAPEVIAESIAARHVLGGLCGIVALIDAPGVIKHIGIKPFVRFGELDNSQSRRVTELQEILVKAGVKADVPPDVRLAMWKKFLFIAPVSGVTAVTRATLGVVRSLPETRELVERAMHEVVAVGQASGVALEVEDVEKTLGLFDESPADGTTSLQRDMQAGKRSELHSQIGAVVRMAKSHAIPAPVCDLLYGALLPQEIKATEA